MELHESLNADVLKRLKVERTIFGNINKGILKGSTHFIFGIIFTFFFVFALFIFLNWDTQLDSLDSFISGLIIYGLILGILIGLVQPRKKEVFYLIIIGPFGALVNLPSLGICIVWLLTKSAIYLFVKLIIGQDIHFFPRQISFSIILGDMVFFKFYLFLFFMNLYFTLRIFSEYVFKIYSTPNKTVYFIYILYVISPMFLLSFNNHLLISIGNIIFWAVLLSHSLFGPFIALSDSTWNGRKYFYAKGLA